MTLHSDGRMLLTMKKLGMLIAAASLSIATPVFACPGHDEAAAPKTAEKVKDEQATPAKKEAPKTEEKTTTETAKAKQAPKADKKPDKVSQK